MSIPFQTLNEVIMNDATAKRAFSAGASPSEIIVILANEKTALLKQIEHLHSIAPRRITLPDGKTYVWRCPDELIPEIRTK